VLFGGTVLFGGAVLFGAAVFSGAGTAGSGPVANHEGGDVAGAAGSTTG
jgi:hypothetical protein